MNFIDLFCGCGGLSEGFLIEKFKPIILADYDKYAMDTTKKRLQNFKFTKTKIDKICHTLNLAQDKSLDKIMSVASIQKRQIDLIAAGIPCQAFSTVGRAQDSMSMKNDKRNYLYLSLMKYIEKLTPKTVIIENVSGLLSAKPKKNLIIQDIFYHLESMGYKVFKDTNEILLNSANFGVPQERKRVIIFAVQKKLGINPEIFFSSLNKTHNSSYDKIPPKDMLEPITVKEAINDLPKLKPGEGKETYKNFTPKLNSYLKKIRKSDFKMLYNHTARNHNEFDKKRYMLLAKNNWQLKDLVKDYPELVHHDPKHFGNRYTVQNFDKPGKTIVSHLYKDGNLFIHPDPSQKRTFTVREAARIQSFPDDFIFYGSRTQQYKQVGNAVPVLLAKALAKSLKSIL